ncbi:cardio acceleratory peptide 2b [Condylostylus longicornis]|uniref:cardio acceleratory peptide 2b n=1 Tax=Condylostylus longicornis TaxID=2530218 RepID=UPI00244E004D|nr:cardio acceleratory peptide 2b [Condylostylus longicornis]
MARISNTSFDMILLTSFLVCAFGGASLAGEIEQAKFRRGGSGTVGLFAFPRVGRSDPRLQALSMDMLPDNSYEEYDERLESKRAGLVPFPRVGRSEGLQLRKLSKIASLQQQMDKMDKRTENAGVNGLWFGPRLGRIQKRSTFNNDDDIM